MLSAYLVFSLFILTEMSWDTKGECAETYVLDLNNWTVILSKVGDMLQDPLCMKLR